MLGSYKLTIKEMHLDTFGHMNNAVYLEILEEARWELITSRGYGMKRIQEVGQGPVILEVNLKFLAELKLREDVEITTEALNYNGKIGTLRQQIIKSDGKIAATADFVFGLFDLKARKLIAPTPEWMHAIGIQG